MNAEYRALDELVGAVRDAQRRHAARDARALESHMLAATLRQAEAVLGPRRERLLQLLMLGDPVPKERARVGRGRGYTPEATSRAEDAIRWQLRAVGVRKPVDSELAVELRFFLSGAPRRVDVDNLVKLVLDACNGFVWLDDSQIGRLVVERDFGADQPRTELEVRMR